MKKKGQDGSDPEKGLTAIQVRVLTVLLDCRTITGAAEKAGVSRSTVYRWFEIPSFRAELSRAKRAIFNEALDLINANALKAAQKLIDMLDSRDTTARRQAATTILELGLETRQGEDLEERLLRLEERASGRGLLP